MRFAALVLVLASCGGKVSGEPDDSPGLPVPTSLPPPTCAAVCNHIGGSCGGVSSPECERECATTLVRYASCPTRIEAFMKCMGHTRVRCEAGEAVVIDCSAERVALATCGRG